MNIEYLLQMLDNKLLVLNNAKTQAFMGGDLDMLNKLDEEILGVQNTIYKLRLLLEASLTAMAVNTTVSAVMTAGAAAVQNNPINLNTTSPLDVYDISTYATDPYHEQKIRAILEKMGGFNAVEKIHEYIQNTAPGSPLNGSMVFNAALKYSVDIRLLLAIMELDSFFGTLGIAVSTMNPGNVGNTGSATRIYNTWQDGVEAVADWLNRHRKNPQPTDPAIPGPVWLMETPIPEATAPLPDLEPVIAPVANPTPLPTPEPQIEPIIENPATTTPPVMPEAPAPTEPINTPSTTPEIITAPTSTPEINLPDSTATSSPLSLNKTRTKKRLAIKKGKRVV